jgi:hypothetical protein
MVNGDKTGAGKIDAGMDWDQLIESSDRGR